MHAQLVFCNDASPMTTCKTAVDSVVPAQ